MHKHIPDNFRPVIPIFLLSIISVIAFFILQSHMGFSLLDEGFLWYGAQRVMVGEVPIRDFIAYDIGRYYWSAAFMSLMGDNGIVALRVATAVFQAIAIFIGLTVLARSSVKQSIFFWLLSAATLEVWMALQYRLYDISLPIVLVGALSFLVEQPSSRRYFLTGIIVGLVAVFGRNHGVYGVVGSLSVMFYCSIKRAGGPSLLTTSAAWVSGVALGYLPVLVFLAIVPGFAVAFWDSIRVLFEFKTTNISLPVPWPWLVPLGQVPIFKGVRGVLVGTFFAAIVVFGVLGIVWVIRKKLQNKPVSPALVASVFLALPYAHYAYSRADIEHLAPGVAPFLIGILVLLASLPARIKWIFVVLLCGASLLVMLPAYPGWYCDGLCVEINVGRDKLKIDQGTANNLRLLEKLAKDFAPDGRTFLAAPFWPGAYAALERKSPMWEIYVTAFTRDAAFQQAEIERIKAANPGFVLIYEAALDGRDDLRFINLYPVIDQYVRENFVPLVSLNPMYRLYRSKQAGE